MARFRHSKGSSLLAALAPAAAACVGGCDDRAPAERPGASDEGAAKVVAGVQARDDDGAPSFVRGDFGRLLEGEGGRVAAPGLAAVAPLFGLRPSDLRFDRAWEDPLGYRHFRYRHRVGGEDVVGAQFVVHADPKGQLYAAHGNARPGEAVPDSFVREPPEGLEGLGPRYAGAARSSPALAYVRSSRDGRVYRAWSFVAEGEREGHPYKDRVFVDAVSGRVVDVHPLIHVALSRQIYSAENNIVLPGALKRGEGQAATTDATINGNYDRLGDTHRCYLQLFGRDSYDGAGAALTSSVHYVQNYANAFWNGTQMVYGDGDGTQAGPLALSLDVTTHELTHAVTENESGLVYQDESGAINEAMSDVMAAACEAFTDGAVGPNTWKIAETVWTPTTPGDALRYLNNPTLDGYSSDYYPERLLTFEDNGGVHGNSGVANHAFYLLTVGGKHVRNKTPAVTVPALGIEKAGQIWYRANANYLTPSSNFQALRAALRQAATDLYGESAGAAADKSMDAVGVPGGAPPPPPTTVTLVNGQPLGGQGTTTGNSIFYSIDLPAGANTIRVTSSGGTGDADLYGKIGLPPGGAADATWKSELMSTNETLNLPNGTAGKLYVQMLAYATFANVTIKAEYATGSSPPPPPPAALSNGVSVTNLSGAKSSKAVFTFDVPAGATNLRFKTSGGSGDADLYVKFGAEPTTSNYDSRSATGSNAETVTPSTVKVGKYYVMVYGFAAFSGVSLTASYTP
jgi:vibriolysin